MVQNTGDGLTASVEEPLQAPVPVFGPDKGQRQVSNVQVGDALVQNLPDEQPLLAPASEIAKPQDEDAPQPVANRNREPGNDDDGVLLPPSVLL